MLLADDNERYLISRCSTARDARGPGGFFFEGTEINQY
ncbi:hypothetical protein QFZ42_001868 [Variovorax paradoxus]|nr:hypothetical protein [Variovorax paradoxus]